MNHYTTTSCPTPPMACWALWWSCQTRPLLVTAPPGTATRLGGCGLLLAPACSMIQVVTVLKHFFENFSMHGDDGGALDVYIND
jgi:hypothetical protein